MKITFRTLYLMGLIILFFSLFLDWYIFQILDARKHVLVYWSYNPLRGWTTIFSKKNAFNNSFKPANEMIPFSITCMFIISWIGALYSTIVKDLEECSKEIEKVYPFCIIIEFLLALNVFYIVVFPIWFLISSKFYFPYLLIKDNDANIFYWYSIGPGYILQCIGFLLIFPYSIFFYHTINQFRSQKSTLHTLVEKYLQSMVQYPDFDELIAKEELNLKSKSLAIPSNRMKKSEIPIPNYRTVRRKH